MKLSFLNNVSRDLFALIVRTCAAHSETLVDSNPEENKSEEEKVDLVVIASKGRSNLIGTLHGSNAENVFRRSLVPVLCVRRGPKVQPESR